EASSATIRDLTGVQAHERVLELLPAAVHPRIAARDIWTTPVKAVEAGTPLSEVDELLNRYHINAMPVVMGERVVGLVTRQIVGRALQHGLLSVPVEEYMVTEFATVGPDAPLSEIQDRIIRGNQRFLPVVQGRRLVAAVTRTDLLRALHGPEQTESIELARGVQDRNAGKLLTERLEPDVLERLTEIGRAAHDLQMEAYLVGGLVRDLFLRKKNLDVDVVVEGDAIVLASVLADHWGAGVRAHRAFRTATVILPDGFRIDLATARTEYYPQPAALPAVETSSLKLDLYRRDFTINTLALRLDPRRFGEVIDFFGGLRDVKEGTIRILHNLSFVEDPTRVLRALRFQVRFGFHLGRQTQKLLRSAVSAGFVAQARGKRLLQEWIALLKEGDPARAIEVLEEQGILTSLHPSLRLDGKTRELVERVKDVVTWFQLLYLDAPLRTWFIYLLAVLDPLSDDEIEEWAVSFGVRDREGRSLLAARRQGYRALSELRVELERGVVRDSRTYEILHRLDQEVMLFLMAKTKDEEKRKLISRYYTKLSGVRPHRGGRELRALGIPPGPLYRPLLSGLLKARLDGEVKTPEEETQWVLACWRRLEAPPAAAESV
ncbi:MAG: CBS domain-containing protein, partial [Deltaproteobacteria bacterium]|nr:CBS domain-containing protein [Deltaproteobacteria bacterium]